MLIQTKKVISNTKCIKTKIWMCSHPYTLFHFAHFVFLISLLDCFYVTPKYVIVGDNIEGFWPEWCISTIYHAWDAPLWLGTLEL